MFTSKKVDIPFICGHTDSVLLCLPGDTNPGEQFWQDFAEEMKSDCCPACEEIQRKARVRAQQTLAHFTLGLERMDCYLSVLQTAREDCLGIAPEEVNWSWVETLTHANTLLEEVIDSLGYTEVMVNSREQQDKEEENE